MSTLAELVRDLRAYEGRKELTRALRVELRRPVPAVRKGIKARALATLPRSGGLNRWVAAIRITVKIALSGRRATVELRGGRNSRRDRSDVRAIDRGRVRAPSWGRRSVGQWHNQVVEPGFFTEPSADLDAWRDACATAVDEAMEVIRRG